MPPINEAEMLTSTVEWRARTAWDTEFWDLHLNYPLKARFDDKTCPLECRLGGQSQDRCNRIGTSAL